MDHRTIVALDSETARCLERLALVWQLSQAEAVRRAMALAEASTIGEVREPASGLRALHRRGGGMDWDVAVAYLADLHGDQST